jgi:cell fate regulator YaaT (PSP1 superfamily)
MHLIRAVFSFNGLKLKFIFTAEERVDFRELVKDLAKHFKKQIHLQQIGPRDRAKHIVAYGKCGQKTCCNRYLNNFQSITMDMVRSQNLESRGSEKLSGLCGKLLCCLRYEVESYEKAKKNLPPIGSRVKTAEYEGRVISQDILNKTLKLRVDENIITIPTESVETILSES